jgi:hypothetical protein
MRKLIVVALFLLAGWTHPGKGAIIGYNFSGLVLNSVIAPYGVSIANFSPVSGSFYYDTTAVGIPVAGGDITTYPQQIAGGFSASFGGVAVSTDSYVVTVGNDYPQQTGAIDYVRITFASNWDPAPTGPLYVNGIGHAAGLFSVNLSGTTGLYTSSAIPSELNLGSFNSTFSFLSDTPTGNLDLFNVTSLTAVPEPSAALLIIVGLACLSFLILRRGNLFHKSNCARQAV